VWHAERQGLSSRLIFAAALIGAVFSAWSCGRKTAPVSTAKAPPSASATKASAVSPSVSAAAVDDEVASQGDGKVVEEQRPKSGKLSGVDFGEVSEIGPAGPASASAEGVVMVTRTGEVLLVPSASLPGGERAQTRPSARSGTALDRPAADFAPISRGPAVAGGFAYFVLEGKLVRRRLGGSAPLETLADDARNGARVSALPASGKQPAVVAYITRPDKEGTSLAKLWLNGRTLPITVEGAGASSVSLVRTDSMVLALSIDGRSAMTPVHARPLDLEAAEPKAGNDQVVWVAGSAQSLTEIVAGSDGSRLWGFLPIAKDVSHFGLAELGLPPGGQGDAEVSWRLYANGIDFAPVSAATICGSLFVVFARPVEARPRAPQELILSRPGHGETAVVVTAQGFADASLAGANGKGGLLVYVADRRTFALPLRCRS
jgi:hypothetical protein